MVLEQRQPESEPGTLTSMEDIRAQRGMPFDEFCEQHPWWEWTESRLGRRLIDDQGRVWVPMWDPKYGTGICYDEEWTPEAERNIAEVLRRLDEDLAAGRDSLTYLDELDD